MLIPNPEDLGLTDKESTIYELLLRLGELDAARIISETGLKRPTVYKSLSTLEAKSLVNQRQTAETTFFRPESPQKLLQLSESRYASLDRARDNLAVLLPELAALFTLSTERPVVSVFDGVKGIKEVFEDTLRERDTILAVVQAGEIDADLISWLEDYYVKKRVELGIEAKVIAASSSGNSQYAARDQENLRTTMLVPSQQFPFAHEVNVYGTKVAFINYIKDEPLMAIVVNHQRVADTMRAWFNLAWEGGLAVTAKATST